VVPDGLWFIFDCQKRGRPRMEKSHSKRHKLSFCDLLTPSTDMTLSTALKFLLKFFRKRSFSIQNQQPFNNVEPFERILRALFIAQRPYKFSSFLDLRNASTRLLLCARDFQPFRFFFSGSACFSKVAPPENLPSWIKYYGKSESFGKDFGGQNSMRWRGWNSNRNSCENEAFSTKQATP